MNNTSYIGSLDLDSLFTNISLDETIAICVNWLFENTNTVDKQLQCSAT